MRLIFTLTIAVSILTACSAKPAIATATATIPPSPTLTTTPFFTATPTLSSDQQIVLDSVNAALRGGLTVDASGNITNKNGKTAKDFHYDTQTGTFSLQVNGKWVAVDPKDASFDDQGNVIGIVGYKQENGEWAEEIISPAATEILKNLGPTFSMDQLKNPENIKFVDLDVLNSPAFAEALVYAATRGILPVPSENAIPFHSIALKDPAQFDLSGSGNMFGPRYMSNRLVYKDLDKRSWVPALVVNTNVNGLPATIMYYNVKNADGSFGVFGEIDFVPTKWMGYMKERFGLTSDHFPTGTNYTSKKACERARRLTSLLEGQDLNIACEQMMSLMNDPRMKEIFNVWANGSGLANTIVNMSGLPESYVPIIPSGISTIK